ncbi:hypothetical protein WAE58_13580 [Pedobacter panaciterrae]|uniref:Uncharacterized protein n=1 Tax=Pedobacter panaciterrae TaxID=363849 RepID=A0ABU8NMJ5_9SPHI
MNNFNIVMFRVIIAWIMVFSYSNLSHAQTINLKTRYSSISIDGKGFITSIKDVNTKKEYNPKGFSSALMSLSNHKGYIHPIKSFYSPKRNQILLSFSNGAVATIKAEQKNEYFRFQLLSLTKKEQVDNIIWGPYKTNISKTIGDVLGVVRDDDFAIGMLGLNDNTTGGPPTDGDMSFMYYFIHSPDPVKFPLPPNLKEGQTFTIGGDGISDVAFYSHPEEYYRMNYGNGAVLEPTFGSSISMHSRDRKKEQMIRFPVLPDNMDGKANSARYQLVLPTDAGFIGSAMALYACPDSLGLKTIEKIVLAEGLPHPEIDGKWIKDPKAYRPDIAWSGVHDSLVNYAQRLGLKSVQDEGMGEYYPNRQNRWGGKKVNFKSAPAMTIPEYGALMKEKGIRWGLHTRCEFLQPDNNSDVAPVPNDSLSIMQRTVITKQLSPQDTVITVADRAYFNEFGGWEGNHTNVLKIGKELIEYNGITETKPYTFLNVKRGFHGTTRGSFGLGTTIVKLQPNCYHGFAPDMNLQEVYADFYGKWLVDGGMDYIDFDGLESCIYQGHGQYSFKRFFGKLFESYKRNGGKYLRVMGSAVGEGSWHYMSVCNVGGGDHMFSPVNNKWGIEGKDMRYVFESSYLPATFGIINLDSEWTMYDAENLQAKSIGWDATYMLGLSERAVENCSEKNAIFKAYRTWENLRSEIDFSKTLKEKLKDLNYKFHLEQTGKKAFILYPVRENRFRNEPYTSEGKLYQLKNEFESQPLEFAIRIHTPKGEQANGVKITLQNGKQFLIDRKFSDGEFIIFKGNSLYVADRFRKKREEILNERNLMLPNGQSDIAVAALHEGSEKIKIDLVVNSIGKGEKI